MYALRDQRFTIGVTREDMPPSKLSFGFDITAPPVFDESHPRLGKYFFIPLPNPSQKASLSLAKCPSLRIWNDDKVKLSLHTGFHRLIKNADRKLQIVEAEEQEEWTVQIVDAQEGEETEVTNIAKYSLRKDPDNPGNRTLGFEWLGDSQRV